MHPGESRLGGTALTLAYDQRVIAEDLSVAIPDSSFTVIVGPNACGKSTLLRALARMLQPDAGTVLLDGRDIHSLPAKQVARTLGLLPQSSIAPDGITVADLVARGRYPHQGLLRQWSAEDERVVDESMAATGVDDLADRPVDELSGGQRQRVWIAMALAQQTPLLLLDEPTTYLDIAHQIEMLDLCADLHERAGPHAGRGAARPQPRGPLRHPPDRHARRARRGRRATRARWSPPSWSRRCSGCPAGSSTTRRPARRWSCRRPGGVPPPSPRSRRERARRANEQAQQRADRQARRRPAFPRPLGRPAPARRRPARTRRRRRAGSPPATAPGSWRSNGTARRAPRPPSSAPTRSPGTCSPAGPASTTRRDAASPHWRAGPGDGRLGPGVRRRRQRGARRRGGPRPGVRRDRPRPRAAGSPGPRSRVWLATHILFAGFPGQALAGGGGARPRPGGGRPVRRRRPGPSGSNGWLVAGDRTGTGAAPSRRRPAPLRRGPRRLPADPPGLPRVRRRRPRRPRRPRHRALRPHRHGRLGHHQRHGRLPGPLPRAAAPHRRRASRRSARTAWRRAPATPRRSRWRAAEPVEVEVLETERGPVIAGGPEGPTTALRSPSPALPAPRHRRPGLPGAAAAAPRPHGSTMWTARSTCGPSRSTSSRPPTPRGGCCTGSPGRVPVRTRTNGRGSSPAGTPGTTGGLARAIPAPG